MTDKYDLIRRELQNTDVTLIAVSKTRSAEEIEALYEKGQRHFGENRVQELQTKVDVLPKDICWHLIGHLQKNKVKYIAPYIHLIHSVDSMDLLLEINKRAAQNNRIIPCLLQVHIASEETKFGFNREELIELLDNRSPDDLMNVEIAGLMGMATFTEDAEVIKNEFNGLHNLFDDIKARYFKNNSSFNTLSMGMSSDYEIAIECGSNMIRVGTLIFGPRK